ncbi:MAG: hypothetical protein ABW098_15315 [Candidatus Thiodiazotropha sp.]
MNIRAKKPHIIATEIIIYIALPVLAIIGLMWAHPTTSCDETSEAVIYGQGISKEQLETLHKNLSLLALKGKKTNGWVKHHNSEIARAIESINYKRIDMYSDFAFIELEHCRDHGVLLRLEGLGREKAGQKIIISWGEGLKSGSKILWEL